MNPLFIAQRLEKHGIAERPGDEHNPLILSMLEWDLGLSGWNEADEIAWCSGFANFCCDLSGYERNIGKVKSGEWAGHERRPLWARDWLTVGEPIGLKSTWPGACVLIFKRRGDDEPGADVLNAPGHVTFFVNKEASIVWGCGGNQRNTINTTGYRLENLLGVRKLSVG